MIAQLLLLLLPLCAGKTGCESSIEVMWSEEASDVAFAAAPLVYDVSDRKYAVMASFNGHVHSMDIETGTSLEGWPVHIGHSTVHTRPLLYDTDGDSQLDVVIVTSQWELLAVRHTGGIPQHLGHLPPLHVRKNWYEKSVASDRDDIHGFILDDATKTDTDYLPLDPHVLADAVITDLNQDGIVEEFVIPVSYYLDVEDYPLVDSVQNVPKHLWDRYLASALVVFNLTSLSVQKSYHLELTTRDLVYPGYIFATPVIVDLEGTGSLDLIVASATGRLHVLDVDGNQKHGFPVVVDSLHSDISIHDVDNDGKLEMIFVDKNGVVHCIDAKGEPMWETELEGDFFSGVNVVNLTDTASIQVVLTSDTGYIHVLEGQTGQELTNWPQKVGDLGQSSPVVTHLCGERDRSVVVLASDGHLHFISADAKCKQAVNVGETSFVDLVLVPQEDGSNGILVLTKDGTVMYLKQTDIDPPCLEATNTKPLQVHLKNVSHISGTEFQLPYSLANEPSANHSLMVYLGKRLLFKSESIEKEGVLTIATPSTPVTGHLQTVVVDEHRRIYVDIKFVHFNSLWRDDVRLVLMFPSLMLAGLLLFAYGFSVAQLLPFTQQAKDV